MMTQTLAEIASSFKRLVTAPFHPFTYTVMPPATYPPTHLRLEARNQEKGGCARACLLLICLSAREGNTRQRARVP